MLSNPELENPVNLEAAQMLIKDESLYKQVVLRLFNQPSQCKRCFFIVFLSIICYAFIENKRPNK